MKRFFFIILVLFLKLNIFSNTPTDSLIRFSDLVFSSDFEKNAFTNLQKGNDFALCLSTNKEMSEAKAAILKKKYDDILKQLINEKLSEKNIRQKFKKTHKILFNMSPMRYYKSAEFSEILDNGDFNYLTASVLYSLTLKDLHIPTYFLFRLDKTDIIVNPDDKQEILETLNRTDENGYFNSSNKKSFIVNILDKNIQIGSEFQYNSTKQNSKIKFNDSETLKNNKLPALLYFYKSLYKLENNQKEEAYSLIRKACYLFPQEPIVTTMYAMLGDKLNNCKFDKVEDVDLLGQISRFPIDNFDNIKNIFLNMIKTKYFTETNPEFCEAAYNRLISQIADPALSDEISYNYYIVTSTYYFEDMRQLKLLVEALKIKPNDRIAQKLMEVGLQGRLRRLDNDVSALDSLNLYEKELANSQVNDAIQKLRLITYLNLAANNYLRNKPNEGEKYLCLFEAKFELPVPDNEFKYKIENAYYECARYYARFEKHAVAKKMVERGLKYIPNSNMIESATEGIYNSKPRIFRKKMTKTEYDKYMSKKINDF